MTLGYSLNKLAKYLICEAICKKDREQELDLERFKKLMSGNWSELISSKAGRNLDESKFKKVPVLPLAEDVVKINMYLKDSIQKLSLQLTAGDTNAWPLLCKSVACYLLLFVEAPIPTTNPWKKVTPTPQPEEEGGQ